VTRSSTVKRFYRDNGSWDADTVIDVVNERVTTTSRIRGRRS
jgi:hypothetical protein